MTSKADWKHQAKANAATIQRQAARIQSLEAWLSFERDRTTGEVEKTLQAEALADRLVAALRLAAEFDTWSDVEAVLAAWRKARQ